jgi:hypothetical protein
MAAFRLSRVAELENMAVKGPGRKGFAAELPEHRTKTLQEF